MHFLTILRTVKLPRIRAINIKNTGGFCEVFKDGG